MQTESKIDFGDKLFWKLVYCLILESKNVYWSNEAVMVGSHAFNAELTRLFNS